MTILQIFLMINTLILGVAATLAVQYALAHRRGVRAPKQQNPNSPLTPEMRKRLTKQAEENFQGITNRASLQLQHDLGITGEHLKKKLDSFGTTILDEEVALFRKNVADMRSATQGILANAQTEVSNQQAALLLSISERDKALDEAFERKRTELEAGLVAAYDDKETRIERELDSKLNDAVVAFLSDTLGTNVDLGAQTEYLLDTLEQNKATLLGKASAK